MKKVLKFTIPMLALLVASAIPVSKTYAVYAEGEESSIVEESSEEISSEVSSELSSEVVSSEEPVASIDVGEIVIGDKTLEEWKAALKDASTRQATIISLVWTIAILLISTLQWLADRGLIKRNGSVADRSEALLGKMKSSVEDFDKFSKEAKEEITKTMNEMKATAEKMVAELAEVKEMNKELVDVLLLIIKSDPDLIRADVYSKALGIVKGETKDGE